MVKASNSKKTTSGPSQGRKKVLKFDKTADSKPKQLEWGSNETWMQRAIEYLTHDVKFRLRLFSDTTSGAKAEGRLKVQASESKIALYGILASAIFKTIDDEATREEFEKDPLRFSRSTQQQFQRYCDYWGTVYYHVLIPSDDRLKKTYQKYAREIQATGEGIKETDGEDINLIGQSTSQTGIDALNLICVHKQSRFVRNGHFGMTCMGFGASCQTIIRWECLHRRQAKILEHKRWPCLRSQVTTRRTTTTVSMGIMSATPKAFAEVRYLILMALIRARKS
jgi:hypothetical protein